MSGVLTGNGLRVFSLVGDGQGRRATRRDRANAALTRHRQKPTPAVIEGASYDVWAKWLAWQLEWENAIYRYRDGNTSKGQSDD